MPHITLHFVGTSSYSLDEVSFSSKEHGVDRVSKRGSGLLPSSASFPWTAGVRALAVALLKHRISQNQSSADPWVLAGGTGSLARSLDYSFAKQPLWLLDMFGIDKSGNALARRILLRDNPEGKRPGPTRFAVNSKLIAPNHIEVYCSGRKLHDALELQCLVESLECTAKHARASRPRKACVPRTSGAGSDAASCTNIEFTKIWCTKIATEEAKRVLANTKSFSNNLVNEHLALAQKRMLNRVRRIFPLFELSLPSIARAQPSPDWATLRRTLERHGGLTVGISTGGVASIAIFDRLAMRGLPVRVDYAYANSQETVARIRDGSLANSVDAVNLSVACALRLMSDPRGHSFVPFMVMPHNSHATVSRRAPPKTGAQNHGRFVPLLYSDCSSAALYEPGPLRGAQRTTRRVCDGPVELIGALLENEDAYSPVWWPHYEILRRAPNLTAFDLQSRWEYDLTVLFLHVRFVRDRELAHHLVLAARDAWLELLENPGLVEQLVAARHSENHSENEFVKFFMRSCAMFDERLKPTPQADICELTAAPREPKDLKLVVNKW